jgi:hypothetical protein
MLAGVGCVVSSAITLVIFFPRSIENEIAAKDASRETSREKRMQRSLTRSGQRNGQQSFGATQSYTTPPSPKLAFTASSASDQSPVVPPSRPIWKKTHAEYPHMPLKTDSPGTQPPQRPRRWDSDPEYEVGFMDIKPEKGSSRLNPLVHNFTSPIDIAYAYAAAEASKEPRFAFTRNPA